MMASGGAARRRRLLMAAPVVGGVIAFALTLWGLNLLVPTPGPEDSSPRRQAAPTASETAVAAPTADVQRVHEAMHDIAARCQPGVPAGPDARSELDRDVDVILTFARKFPNARLTVDDESGHTVSLLLGVRDDLRRCASDVAARLDPAIPPKYRAPAGAAPS